MYWHDVSWWGWLMMSVGMLVVYGLIVWGIALLLRGRDTAGAGRSSPEDILGEWLARGEIDAWEYRGGVQALRSRGDRPREPIS
jgi:putative membrane protein